MSTDPTCPLCDAPIIAKHWSPTDAAEQPARCSRWFPEANRESCEWEDRWPYVCAHCGGHRLTEVPWEKARAWAGRKLISLGTVCQCGSSFTGP